MLQSLFLSNALLVTVVDALVVDSSRLSNNNHIGSLVFQRTGGSIWSNNLNKIPRGGNDFKREPQRQLQAQERREVRTALYTNTDDEYTPNVYPKTIEETAFIEEVLQANFLFQDLFIEDHENQELAGVVSSFEKQVYDKGTLLCEQGDTENTDYLYLIANGTCSIAVDGKVLPEPYGTIGSGSLIGDLALLYGTPRAATVRAKTDVKVYRLHRADFHHFMDYAAADRDEKSSSSSRAEKVKRDIREIDSIIDRISGVKTKYDGDIIQQFKPSRKWLWSRWKGTVMQHAWKSAVVNMSISLSFMLTLRLLNDFIFKTPITWPVGAIPDAGHPLIIRMKGMFKMWSYTMSITTLLVSFYLNTAYSFWRGIYVSSRKIQGTFEDLYMLLACMAERDPRTGSYTDRARVLLDDVAAFCRLGHAFSWAALINRFNVLLTPRGLSRMLSRSVITRPQFDNLVGTRAKESAPQQTTMMWIMSRILKGMEDGVLPNDHATRHVFIQKVCVVRSTFGGIRGNIKGSFPMAYAQFIQVLVDIVLMLAPFALYCELGIWSVLAVGVLNIFFSGMNDLAKILLDPMDNSDQTFYKGSSVNMDVGVLIRESNAGSKKWKAGLEKLPF